MKLTAPDHSDCRVDRACNNRLHSTCETLIDLSHFIWPDSQF